MSTGITPPAETHELEIGTLQKRALGVGVAGALLLVVGFSTNRDQFFRSYLIGYLFWLGVPLGSLALLMLHHLTGGAWGFVIRRLCEASARTFWVMAVLFLPIALGLGRVYHEWAGGNFEAHSALKAMYLTPNFFLARAVVYFVVWASLGFLLSKWSLEEDRAGGAEWHLRMEALSAPGLILFGLTSTFAMVDWAMSLEPQWFSTIYGMIFIVVQVLSALAFLIVMAQKFSGRQPLVALASPAHFHDLGTLLFAFVMLWAYLSFSQFLIIWAGNIKSEIPWYTSRATGGWAAIAVFLIIFHFAAPFLLLLNRPLKRRKEVLAVLAGAMMVVSAVDVFWLVAPAFFKDAPRVHAMDVVAPVAIGGLWIAAFAGQLRGKPLVPLNDPRLQEAYEHGD
jgi:hypothetical protein